MARRQTHGRSPATLLALVLLSGILPTAGPARAADEVGPSEPVELPVQPGTPNTVAAVRPVPPAEVISAAAGGGPAVLRLSRSKARWEVPNRRALQRAQRAIRRARAEDVIAAVYMHR